MKSNLRPTNERSSVKMPGIVLLMPTRGRPTVETLTATSSLDRVPALIATVSRKGIIDARNELAATAIEVPQRANIVPELGWYALWVDDDAFWPPGTISRMLGAIQDPKIDILAGWFGGRCPRGDAKAERIDASHPRPGVDCNDGDIIEVERIGFHFVMHKIDVLEKLGPNPFSLDETIEKGEDLAFCARVRAAGLRIWVHTGAPVAHIDDDGTAYLPGLGPMRVVGNQLIKAEDSREYGGLEK